MHSHTIGICNLCYIVTNTDYLLRNCIIFRIQIRKGYDYLQLSIGSHLSDGSIPLSNLEGYRRFNLYSQNVIYISQNVNSHVKLCLNPRTHVRSLCIYIFEISSSIQLFNDSLDFLKLHDKTIFTLTT